jgi:hypothetical protein
MRERNGRRGVHGVPVNPRTRHHHDGESSQDGTQHGWDECSQARHAGADVGADADDDEGKADP